MHPVKQHCSLKHRTQHRHPTASIISIYGDMHKRMRSIYSPRCTSSGKSLLQATSKPVPHSIGLFMYRAISNNLQAINLRDLMDAAHLLGASTWRAAFMVVLPNLRKGLMVSVFLSFSFLFGEFVFANLLVGSRYETLQVYLYNMRNDSGHFTSALVISYFMFVLLMTWAANRLNKDKS